MLHSFHSLHGHLWCHCSLIRCVHIVSIYIVALETLCAKKDEELASKTRQIEMFQRKMKHMKEAHKQEMEKLHLKVQQELYVAQTLTNCKLPMAATRKSTKRKQ